MNFGGSVTVGEITHEMSGFGEELEVFWSSFFGARFGSFWSERDGVGGNGVEEI
jgi:hypothetical protein